MSIIYVLLPVSIFLALIALAFYIWAVKHGQFDDLETPAMRVLFEDEQELRQDPQETSEDQ